MSDHFEQARRRAQLQQQENQQHQQERELRKEIDRIQKETPQLQERNKVLQDEFKKYPNKPTPEQEAQHGKNTDEYRQNLSTIEKNKLELPQKQQELKDLQFKDQAMTQAGKIHNNGYEESYKDHAVTPPSSMTSKGGVKREFHQTTANSYPPKPMPMSNANEVINTNYQNKENQPKAKGSEHFNAAEKKGKENESKPKQPQQTNQNQNENDNER